MKMIRVDLTNVFIFCMKSIMYCQNTIIYFFLCQEQSFYKKKIHIFFFFALKPFSSKDCMAVYTNDEGQFIISEFNSRYMLKACLNICKIVYKRCNNGKAIIGLDMGQGSKNIFSCKSS